LQDLKGHLYPFSCLQPDAPVHSLFLTFSCHKICFPQDLKGHLYPFCRDQHGSRLVQQQLESADAALVAGGG